MKQKNHELTVTDNAVQGELTESHTTLGMPFLVNASGI
jgi:hypothetical protein